MQRILLEMQWLMLQQEEPKDYVIATGRQFKVRDFVIWAAAALGIQVEFQGQGNDEIGIARKISGKLAKAVTERQIIIKVDPRYFRPTEVDTLLGDARKSERELGWTPKTDTHDMCVEMTLSDYRILADETVIGI